MSISGFDAVGAPSGYQTPNLLAATAADGRERTSPPPSGGPQAGTWEIAALELRTRLAGASVESLLSALAALEADIAALQAEAGSQAEACSKPAIAAADVERCRIDLLRAVHRRVSLEHAMTAGPAGPHAQREARQWDRQIDRHYTIVLCAQAMLREATARERLRHASTGQGGDSMAQRLAAQRASRAVSQLSNKLALEGLAHTVETLFEELAASGVATRHPALAAAVDTLTALQPLLDAYPVLPPSLRARVRTPGAVLLRAHGEGLRSSPSIRQPGQYAGHPLAGRIAHLAGEALVPAPATRLGSVVLTALAHVGGGGGGPPWAIPTGRAYGGAGPPSDSGRGRSGGTAGAGGSLIQQFGARLRAVGNGDLTEAQMWVLVAMSKFDLAIGTLTAAREGSGAEELQGAIDKLHAAREDLLDAALHSVFDGVDHLDDYLRDIGLPGTLGDGSGGPPVSEPVPQARPAPTAQEVLDAILDQFKGYDRARPAPPIDINYVAMVERAQALGIPVIVRMMLEALGGRATLVWHPDDPLSAVRPNPNAVYFNQPLGLPRALEAFRELLSKGGINLPKGFSMLAGAMFDARFIASLQAAVGNVQVLGQIGTGATTPVLLLADGRVLKLTNDFHFHHRRLDPAFDLPVLGSGTVELDGRVTHWQIQPRAQTRGVTSQHVEEVIAAVRKAGLRPIDLPPGQTSQVGLWNGRPYLLDPAAVDE